MKHDFKTSLSIAKGFGSSHSGTHHWWHQRLTSIIMLLLIGWLIFFLKCITKHDLSGVISLMQKPYNVVPAIILVTTCFYHGTLGMQVVIEDYVSCLGLRYSLIILTKIFSLITMLAFIVALIYMMII